MSSRPNLSHTRAPRRRSRRQDKPPPYPTLEPFARRLEELRLGRGLTQRALAKRARVSTNHYQEIAHARANPTVIVLLRLAAALEVPLVELFDRPPATAEEHRIVSTNDLRDLTSAHKRLTDIVGRLAKAVT
jgi:transcriptional regulator with XRE-family HTH domain